MSILSKNEIDAILEAIEWDGIVNLRNAPDDKGKELVRDVMDTLCSESFPVYAKLNKHGIVKNDNAGLLLKLSL